MGGDLGDAQIHDTVHQIVLPCRPEKKNGKRKFIITEELFFTFTSI